MAGKRGFFRNAMDALIAARTQQVAGYVDRALLLLGDDELKARGYNRDDLKRRAGQYYYY